MVVPTSAIPARALTKEAETHRYIPYPLGKEKLKGTELVICTLLGEWVETHRYIPTMERTQEQATDDGARAGNWEKLALVAAWYVKERAGSWEGTKDPPLPAGRRIWAVPPRTSEAQAWGELQPRDAAWSRDV